MSLSKVHYCIGSLEKDIISGELATGILVLIWRRGRDYSSERSRSYSPFGLRTDVATLWSVLVLSISIR
ncbi:MAG: hypothetical protein GXP16_11170 [Gammaproteobacteria bacterium]|nr:hypothetical protein [Gammaproteobacteria bacterium]